MNHAGRYVAREATISAGISGAISLGMFVLVFGGMVRVPVWGVIHGAALGAG